MTETKSTETTVTRRIHWWSEDNETIRMNVSTEWRGQTVTVEAESYRYRTSDGNLSEWRHYISNGWYGDEDSKFTSKPISDTARTRLRDRVLPIAEGYVSTDAFVESQTASIAGEMRSQVARLNSIYGCDRMIEKIKRHMSDSDQRALLIEAVEAYRAFQKLIGEMG